MKVLLLLHHLPGQETNLALLYKIGLSPHQLEIHLEPLQGKEVLRHLQIQKTKNVFYLSQRMRN